MKRNILIAALLIVAFVLGYLSEGLSVKGTPTVPATPAEVVATSTIAN